MRTSPQHFFDTLTDDDWQMIATALHRLGTPRALEVGDAVLGWRTEVVQARKSLLEALRKVH